MYDKRHLYSFPTRRSSDLTGVVRRFPIGPIAAITPFNFPLNLVAHKVVPAIAAGCPVVLKPAPQTPLTALRSEEHTSELQSHVNIVCRLLLEKIKQKIFPK